MRAMVLSLSLVALILSVTSEASADEAAVHYRLALAHKQAGRLDQALVECREAIRLRPEVPRFQTPRTNEASGPPP